MVERVATRLVRVEVEVVLVVTIIMRLEQSQPLLIPLQ